MPWSRDRLGQTLAPYSAASADQEKAPEAEAQVPIPGHRTRAAPAPAPGLRDGAAGRLQRYTGPPQRSHARPAGTVALEQLSKLTTSRKTQRRA